MKRRGFDLDALEIFVTVVELGHMTKTAQLFGLTQSAVSHAIRQLETTFSVTLFDRKARPLKLTADGRKLWHMSSQIMAETRKLEAGFNGDGRPVMPDLRVGCVDSLAAPFMPRVVKQMSSKLASITIAVALSGQLREEFLLRHLDFIFTNDAFDDVDNVASVRLISEPFLLILPRNAPEVTDEQSLEGLSQTMALIRSTSESNLGRLVDTHLRRIGLEAPRRFATQATDTVIGMVAENIGWAVLPPTALIRSKHYINKIRILPLPGPGFNRNIYLISRKAEFGSISSAFLKTSRSVFVKMFDELGKAAPFLESSDVVF
jgi:DNA-binding transcriptional LysR family regulator